MTISKRNWIIFIIIAILSVGIWYKYTLPQFAFIDLSVGRTEAVKIAKDYLMNERKVDFSEYKCASVFVGNLHPDQYLQKSLGYEKELEFLKKHDYELFFWTVRFFQENEEEEYLISLSAATGEVTSFKHVIKAADARPDQEEEVAKQKAIQFLKKTYNFDPDNYLLNTNHSQKFENRTNYSFAWEKKDVFVKWSEEEDSGGGKLLTGVTVSGDEILVFSKINLSIPSEFYRYMERKRNVGRNLSIIFRVVFLVLLTAAIFHVLVRRNNLVLHTTKNFAIALAGSLFLLHVVSHFNEFESLLFHYQTASSFLSYFWRHLTTSFMSMFIVTLNILMPCLSGESLHYEIFPKKREGAFLHYIQSTIFSRNVFKLICFGYIVAIIMIGIQSSAFEIGQRYLGVWVEYIWMAQLSSSYFPILTAFMIGCSASFAEEISFRLFCIPLFKKHTKSIILAIFLSSIIWGYGHSTYPVYPMWFRGLEVTLLGFFLSFIYLRYGLIPVLVAHYLFDISWVTSPYLLGESTPYLYFSSLFVLFIPLIFGLIAYFINRTEKERPLRWKLNRHQIFNLEVLKEYLQQKGDLKNKLPEQATQEIVEHGWDVVVAELAVEDIMKKQKK